MSYKDDQFFADEELTDDLTNALLRTIKRKNMKNPSIFEATAGDGRLVQHFQSILPESVIYANDLDSDMVDIMKEKGISNVQNENYITYDWRSFFNNEGVKSEDLIICTGFPYGSDSVVAIDCFNANAAHGDTMVIIMPASFNRQSIINLLDPSFHLVSSKKVHRNAFVRPNSRVKKDVGSVIQVWERREQKRNDYSINETHLDFSFYDKRIDQKINLSFYVRGRNDLERVYYGDDADWRPLKDHLHFCDPDGLARKTVDNFKWWKLLQNNIGAGYIRKSDFILAHENYHYGLHQDYFDMIS